jgi:hypothetical protein
MYEIKKVLLCSCYKNNYKLYTFYFVCVKFNLKTQTISLTE